ncbi:MAG: DoxX family membrane protein [Archangium sp.]|nr:DoxX family membrane protein [Archangium sp.]
MISAGRWLLAVFFVVAGLNHFRDPAFYLSMMPPPLPFPEALNALSGACEVAGGVGVLVPRTRRAAGWGLIALLIAVFPANIYAALQGQLAGLAAPAWALWARLPFQALFLAWVWAVTLRKEKHP